jgi:hypothetical protein
MLILPWIDIIWLPLAYFFVAREQRMWAIGCILGCMAMMRMLTELMQSINYPAGFTGFWSMPVHNRGLLVYSLFYLVYLLIAHYSPYAKSAIFMTTSIMVFFASSLTFALVMLI